MLSPGVGERCADPRSEPRAAAPLPPPDRARAARRSLSRRIDGTWRIANQLAKRPRWIANVHSLNSKGRTRSRFNGAAARGAASTADAGVQEPSPAVATDLEELRRGRKGAPYWLVPAQRINIMFVQYWVTVWPPLAESGLLLCSKRHCSNSRF